MAEPDEAQERLDRIERWAQNLRDVLHDGDELVLRIEGDTVLVEETPFACFRAQHPRLYGRLTSLEAQLDTGCLLYLVGFLIPGGLILGLRAGWWEDWLDAGLRNELNSWWCYLILFSATAYLVNYTYDRLKRRIYRRQRSDIMEMIHAEGFDRDTLLPLLEDAENLEGVVRQLKLDPGPFPPTAVGKPRLLGHAEDVS